MKIDEKDVVYWIGLVSAFLLAIFFDRFKSFFCVIGVVLFIRGIAGIVIKDSKIRD